MEIEEKDQLKNQFKKIGEKMVDAIEKSEQGIILEKTLEKFKSGKVKELSVSMNTSQSGASKHITKKITGLLEGVLISTDKPVQVEIVLNGFREIILLNLRDFHGTQYLPIRTWSVLATDGELEWNSKAGATEKFCLNDELIVAIKGAKLTQTKFLFRYI